MAKVQEHPRELNTYCVGVPTHDANKWVFVRASSKEEARQLTWALVKDNYDVLLIEGIEDIVNITEVITPNGSEIMFTLE